MSQITPAEQTANGVSADSKKTQIFASAIFGFIILMVVGFAPIEVVHNATHDTRHSTGFPCH
jgi:cobalt transporter subunit CbtB